MWLEVWPLCRIWTHLGNHSLCHQVAHACHATGDDGGLGQAADTLQ